MRIKPGARLNGLRPEMVVALLLAREVCAVHDHELVITSALDGEHQRASLHYVGCALDLRRPASPTTAAAIAKELGDALGNDYDVILEADHIHVEFQPKARL